MLGRGSRVEADEQACRRAGVAIRRRGSGGGPVVWGPHLLALDVVVPPGHPLHTPDVTGAYRWLGQAIAAALREVGLDEAAAVTPQRARVLNDPALAAVACYAGVSPWEVLVDGRKVAGLSQIRRAGRIALQAGILLGPDDPPVLSLIRIEDADPTLATRVAARTAVVAAEPERVRSAVDRRVVDALTVA